MKTTRPLSTMWNLILLTLFVIFSMPASAALTVFLEVYGTSCDGNDGAVLASTTGGVGPYTYSWSNGMTDPEIYGLTPGEYTVTVTDNLGAEGTNTGTVNFIGGAPNGSGLFQNIAYNGLSPCIGECNGGVRLYLLRQSGGYTVSVSPNLNVQILPYPIANEPDNSSYYQRYEILGACAGQTYTLYVSSSCGSGSTSFEVYDLIEPVLGPLTTTGSCTGASDGSVSGEVTIDVNTTPIYIDEFWQLSAVDDQGAVVFPTGFDPFVPGTYDFQILGLHPGDWTLRLSTSESDLSGQAPCVYDTPFTVEDLGTNCSTLSGTVHFETDMDCVQDGVEVGIPYQLLRVTPGPMYGITTDDGSYSIDLPYGSYSLEQLNTYAVQLCPAVATVDLVVSNGMNTIVDLADSMLTPFNMALYVIPSVSRVGFPFRYSLRLINHTGGTGEDIEITLDHDPLFSFISGSDGAMSSPGQVQWTLPALAPFEQRWLNVELQVPADPGLLGYVHQYSAAATTSSFEPNTSNNTYSGQGIVVASYDPNDKVGTASVSGSTTQFFIDEDEWIDYVIRFQNTGTDTAFTIVVRDEFEEDLDIESLRIIGGSHPFVPSFGNDRELVFTFSDILLPDSTTDLLGSQGFVAFSLRPRAGLLPGDVIENIANIYFDFNEPVITEPSVLVAEFSTGLAEDANSIVRVFPNPNTGRFTIHMEGQSLQRIELLSVDGRLQRTIPMQGEQLSIDMTDLATGHYLLRLYNSEAITTRPIIKL